MKQIGFILAMFFALNSAFAQGDDNESRKERIERLKRAYISEKLDLTVAEAEKFWPLYNEFSDQRKTIKKEMRQAERSLEGANLSERDVATKIDFIAQKQKEDADARGRFAKSCLPVLGTQKTIRLMGLEEEFRKEMMDKLRERRQQQGGGGGPRGGRGR